jgi:hypothetical protein
VAKVKINDEAKVFGLSGAASFLNCDYRTVLKHADALRLPCTRDSSGKRLFTLADLQHFKNNNRIGNQGRPNGDLRRSAQS